MYFAIRSETMRASRLLSILIHIQLRGRVSASALARAFEVTPRTIQRDIDALSAAGVPVYAERGRNGGFALLDGYRTRLTGFSAGEADALLLAGAPQAAAALGLGPALTAAEQKLLASLPPESSAKARRVGERFLLDPVPWYTGPEPAETVRALAEAVWTERRVRLVYESWTGQRARTLAPLGLVLKAGVWYLVALSESRAIRTFRISSIQRFDGLAEPFRRPARFDLSRHWERASRDFETRQLDSRAIVRLSPEGLRRLREVSPAGHKAASTCGRKDHRAGWITAEIPVESSAFAVRQLLSLGPEVEVLAPAGLRKALAETAREIAARHARSRDMKNQAPDGKT